MKTYQIQSSADSRSKSRRNMTHLIEATSEEDARYEARMRHIRRVGWNSSIATTIIAVDGVAQ